MDTSVYDMTMIHEPEENDVAMEGDIECPECGELIFPDLTDEVLNAAVESPIAAPVDCPDCGSHLEFLIEPLPTEEIGLGITAVYR